MVRRLHNSLDLSSTSSPAGTLIASVASARPFQARAGLSGRTAVIVALATAWALRLLLAAVTLHLGFMEYNADGFTRVIHGFEWLQHPRWEVGVWLPLHFWLIGGALALWDNLYDAPKLLSTICGLITIANLYLITRTLGGRRAALIAGLLAALFPFEVWFSVSGMSEPVFHALLTTSIAAFVRWQRSGRSATLALTGLALCAATAVRYEGWFYAAILVPMILLIALLRRQFRPETLPLALIPMVFIGIWIEQSAKVLGDPLAFAHQTSEIKSELAPQNAAAGSLHRLIYFPGSVFSVERSLVLLGGLACVWLLWRYPRRWRSYVILIAGEAALLSAVSATFANIGPGSERYLLSNVLLLIPPLAAAIVDVASMRRLGLLVAVAVVVVLLVSFGHQLAAPPRTYPDHDTRALGRFLAAQLRTPDPSGRTSVPVFLPPPPTDAYNASYAIRILSGNSPDIDILDQQDQFEAIVASGAARLWAMDLSNHVALQPPAAARTERIGRFLVGWPLPALRVSLASGVVRQGSTVSVRVADLQPGEGAAAWLTRPDGRVVPLPGAQADASGRRELSISIPRDAPPGRWALTVAGQRSRRQGIATFEVHP